MRTSTEATRILALASLGCLALGILWSLQAATHVESVVHTRAVDPWVERAAFTYAPILADGSGALPMNEPGYFTTDAPQVLIRFEWSLDDAEAERVTALGTLALHVRAPGGAGRAALDHVEPLGEGTLTGAAQDKLVLEGVVDLPALEAQLSQPTGRKPTEAAWEFVAKVRFESAPETSHRADASTFTLPLTYSPPLYVLPSEAAAKMDRDHTGRESYTVETTGGLDAVKARPVAPALALLGLLGAATFLPRALDREEGSA